MLRRSFVLAFLLLPLAVAAQPATADVLPEAEASFENGLASYESGVYEEAFRLFDRAATGFEFHARTTAALLMAGKSAYALGDFDQAIARLTRLIQRYPGSRYRDEAERVLALAVQGGPDDRTAPEVFHLGVALPATGETGYLAQALFNGIRLAVDEHNAANAHQPVRLVFRDTGGTEEGARAAVEQAARAGATVVIGPLFSEEAVAAGDAADRQSVVLIAPLATEESVSQGRRLIFQTNPTFRMRGRVMADYATRRLGLTRFGVVANRDSYGDTMADAFEEEARSLGAQVLVSARLTSGGAWDRLGEEVAPDALFDAEAVYLPVSGGDAAEHAADALRSLEQLGLTGRTRPLGNTEWEGLAASRDRASAFRTVFTQDFHVDDAASAAFVERYRALAGLGADRLALIGYDATRFLLQLVDTDEPAPELADRIRRAPLYQGLAHRIHFDGEQVNRALFIMGYQGGEAVVVE
ncbi:MAG: ABC transporter substrate-binding protein [Rhodothermaceae bacterium]|nr:ABC transporter substrate-binding protein [Rhodothermaceae bacterium]